MLELAEIPFRVEPAAEQAEEPAALVLEEPSEEPLAKPRYRVNEVSAL